MPVRNDSLTSPPKRTVLLFAALMEVSALGGDCHHSTDLSLQFSCIVLSPRVRR